MNSDTSEEIAALAAQWVVEEGLEYGPAKQKAARSLGGRRAQWPSNEQVEDQVREHIALFCAETQGAELAALRDVAVVWMERLAAFSPHLSGAVWRGTATRRNAVHLDLYCEDSKAAEIFLLNQGQTYDVQTLDDGRPEALNVLSLNHPCPALGEAVTVHLFVRDFDEQRGALKPDARGRSWRGDLKALRQRLQELAAPSVQQP